MAEPVFLLLNLICAWIVACFILVPLEDWEARDSSIGASFPWRFISMNPRGSWIGAPLLQRPVLLGGTRRFAISKARCCGGFGWTGGFGY